MKIALTADTHLKENRPACRTDDFLATQRRKWLEFFDTCKKEQVSICLHGGDLTDTNPPSEFIKRWFILLLRESIFVPFMIYEVLGQHDMEHHSIKSWFRTGAAVLDASQFIKLLSFDFTPYTLELESGKLINIYGCHFGQEIQNPKPKVNEEDLNILVVHKLLLREKEDRPQMIKSGDYGYNILHKYEGYDLILSGDNHQTFTVNIGKRWLVNPGSMLRLKSDQIDHKPCFFIYDTESEEVKQFYYTIENCITVKEKVKEKDDNKNLEKLIEEMKGEGIKLNFKDNLSKLISTRNPRKAVQDIIWQSFKGVEINL